MEQRGGADAFALALEGSTPRKLSVFQVLDGGEVLVNEGGIGQRPEVLSGLQFGGIRRQEEQMHMVRHLQPEAGVPPSAIQHEDNLLVGAGANLARELRQLDLEERDGDTRGQMKECPSRGGMDKANQVAPGKAVLHRGHWTLTDWRPDAAQQRFQANTMFIGGPNFDLGVGKRGGDRLDQRPQLFLNVSCCSGSAKACCGRGTC